MGKGKVLQDWMEKLSWKQQSVVLSSLRGPDNFYCPNLKKIGKWIRRIIQNNADSSSDYMKYEELPSFTNIEKEVEFSSVHYFSHLIQGLEIIGYNHPDVKTSEIAIKYYEELTREILHLNPESKSQLEERLKDKN